MSVRNILLNPFPPITSLQPQRFHAITHSFAQRESAIPPISNSFRTLLMLTGGGTPLGARLFNRHLKYLRLSMSDQSTSRVLALPRALCDNRKPPEDNVSVTQP